MLGTWIEAQAQLGGSQARQLPSFRGPRQGKPSLLRWAQTPHLSPLEGKDDS